MVAVVEGLKVGENGLAVGAVEPLFLVDLVHVFRHLRLGEADEVQQLRVQAHDRPDVEAAGKVVERDRQDAGEVGAADGPVRQARLERLEEGLQERFPCCAALHVVPAHGVVFHVAVRDHQLVCEVVVFVDDDVERGKAVLANDISHFVNAVRRTGRLGDFRPIGKFLVFGGKTFHRTTNV